MRVDHRHRGPASVSKHGLTLRVAFRAVARFGDQVPRPETLANEFGMSRSTAYRFARDYQAVVTEPHAEPTEIHWVTFGDRRQCIRVARAMMRHFGDRAPTAMELQAPPFSMTRATAFRVWRQYVDSLALPAAARQGRAA